MSKQFHLNYTLLFPELGRSRSAGRKVTAYCLYDAVARLRKSIESKWATEVKIEVTSGYRKDADGWTPMNIAALQS